MTLSVFLALLNASALAQDNGSTVADDHPVHLDRTGIQWVLPFTAAEEVAARLERPLLMKAVAFGTTTSGCW